MIRFKTTLITGAIFLILLIFWLATDKRSGTAPEEWPVGPFSADTISYIEIRDDDQHTVLERVSMAASVSDTDITAVGTDAWVVSNRENYPADTNVVTRALGLLGRLNVAYVASVSGDRDERFGLDDEYITLTVRADGKTSRLSLGNIGPEYSSTFVRYGDEPRIFNITPRLTGHFPANPSHWLKKNIWDIDSQQVERLHVEWDDQEILIAKEAEGWMLKKPLEGLMRPADATSLTSAFSGLRLFDIADISLDEFEHTATVTADVNIPDREEKIEKTLIIGQQHNPSYHYARTGDSNTIFLLATFTVDTLLNDDPADMIQPDSLEPETDLSATNSTAPELSMSISSEDPFTDLSAEQQKEEGMPEAVITTSRGEIRLELFEDEAPNTVANFVTLAESGYYDGLIFHRVIDDFMIQGGCPQGRGTGGPGYNIACEISWRKHDGPGVLSMANAGPDTNGSQFFITHKETSWLDGNHTVFGQVLEGQDVVDSVEKGDTIETIEIFNKRDHPYEIEKL